MFFFLFLVVLSSRLMAARTCLRVIVRKSEV